MPAVSEGARLLDGKSASRALLSQVSRAVAELTASGAPPPKLAVVLAGDDPASQVYTARKTKIAIETGLLSERLTFPADVSESVLLGEIERLNANPTVHGVLIQLPLPAHLSTARILAAVDPAKDVDGFHPLNLGRLLAGDLPPALPCTPSGMMTLLNSYDIPLAGRHAVIVGRSTIVGKPMALLLLHANATVTLCHSKTRDLPAVCRQADILVAAVGSAGLITADYVQPGAVVLDVGINRSADGRLTGDADFESACRNAGWITPVPGGVGPMTIAALMANTLALYRASRSS
ncbi:MAG: bifunctional 5,10-methylenetetrahydrofolate dehydrogenase/5,10-methenyltetrahydrofolate cyclohydrolase [Vampirovibrionales bacterium]|nr:bifunctional 5,10-methylenetetrahydrofolate dehydrogenase/5,10-methenyltetrahydrofolate cyclohydrolase [Vampirovibrionales bacterium]